MATRGFDNLLSFQAPITFGSNEHRNSTFHVIHATRELKQHAKSTRETAVKLRQQCRTTVVE